MDGRRRSGMRLTWGIGLLVAVSLCPGGPAVAGQSFDGLGRITAVDLGRGTVTIEHGGIAGLLPATQSEFPVQTAGVIQGVRAGDRVRFTLGAADDSHGLLTITSVTAEPSSPSRWFDRVVTSIAAALGLLTLAAVTTAGFLLWQQLQSLQRRVVALDHEAGMLRGLVSDTQDGVRQIAHALEEAATALRIGYVQELRRRLIPGSAPAATEAAGGQVGGEAVAGLIVIERGRVELYRAVERGAAGPGLTVIWDRRRNDRRRGARRPSGHERRHSERRGTPPETWTRLGFQLVPVGTADVPRGPRVLRTASGERGTPR
jgi:Cu/Ag efflux protein CusF